jgi:leucyl-tRNA---protein transferase
VANLKELPFSALQFYATAPYPCSYLDDRQARSQVATPAHLINADVYSELVKMGFRRSGIFTYRPYCDGCRACVPVRVPVNEYAPNRTSAAPGCSIATSRRGRLARVRPRALRPLPALPVDPPRRRRHGQRQPRAVLAVPAAEQGQHAAGRVPRPAAAGHRRPRHAADDLDHRRAERRAVVGLHVLRPDTLGTSYGTFNIVWQIEQCKALGLPYLYLGYWIEQSPKMAYKARFRPVEMLRGGRWERVTEHKRAR